MKEYKITTIMEFIMEKAGPYAWWMFGAFLLSFALVLVPSNIVVPILRNYYSPDVVPALGILRAYHRAASLAQYLYWTAIVITFLLQLYFLFKTIKLDANHIVWAVLLAAIYLGSFVWVINRSNVFEFHEFLALTSEDIQQLEEGNWETAIIHINPRDRHVSVIGPLDPLINYNTPVERISGIRPGENLGWEIFAIPLSLAFERNTNREYDERRNTAENMQHAQLYRITFTSNLGFVYSIEQVDADYFLAQRPLPEPRNVGYVDAAFFGTWYFDDDPSWTMVFYENGGALRGVEGDMQFFSWGIVNDDILSIYAEIEFGRIRSYSWDFEIDGDYLWMRNRRGANPEERTYQRR